MLVDANILLYAVDSDSRFHEPARSWLEGALNGPRRVGLPWQSLWAFVRISTHPRASASPLRTSDAWRFVESWLNTPATWTPGPTPGHADVLRDLLEASDVSANLVSDAALAAIAIEHGLTIASADSDFARFPVNWINPTQP